MHSVVYSFIKNNMVDIILILLLAASGLILYKRGHRELVRKMVLSLVVEAEKKLGSGTGRLKYDMVLEGLYKRLPLPLRVIYTQQQLDDLIEDAVSRLKDFLSDEESPEVQGKG